MVDARKFDWKKTRLMGEQHHYKGKRVRESEGGREGWSREPEGNILRVRFSFYVLFHNANLPSETGWCESKSEREWEGERERERERD